MAQKHDWLGEFLTDIQKKKNTLNLTVLIVTQLGQNNVWKVINKINLFHFDLTIDQDTNNSFKTAGQ